MDAFQRHRFDRPGKPLALRLERRELVLQLRPLRGKRVDLLFQDVDGVQPGDGCCSCA